MLEHNPWIVLKFGGNSVADLHCWQTIAEITRQYIAKQLRPLIVCSALAAVTNKLEKLIAAAINNSHEDILQEIIKDYEKLAAELSVPFNIHAKNDITELSQIIKEISLSQKVTPLIQAKILSFGEIILTKLGAAYLQTHHFPTTWCDARNYLKSIDLPSDPPSSNYLSARCAYQKDMAVINQLNQISTPVAITQGFIAHNSKAQTVLLGRGGSDTAAAYFAAKLAAVRCEIWTDVPGVYTANPHQIPASRLLKSLDYDEAQEIASMGAKVLHPYCILPLKANKIPLYVGYTRKPDRPGTEITAMGRQQDAPIKSILIKPQVTLIQIETVQMWHQIGFLADVFHYFKKHGLSVDLISTSESAITVSLDLQINSQDQKIVDLLLVDLSSFCIATKIMSCAVISIVGHNIRTVLPKIGEALKVFEGHKIYLLSQASNDLNLSFIVEEDQALGLAKKLHVILIEENAHNPAFDQSWEEEFSSKKLRD